MLKIKVHNKFKKDLKLMKKRGYDEEKLWLSLISSPREYLCRLRIATTP